MNTFIYKFIIAFCAIIFSHHLQAQSSPPENPIRFHLSDSLYSARPAFRLSKDIYVKNLGLMCRQEWKMEKYLKVPLSIRLGSLDHCNYLEGKNK